MPELALESDAGVVSELLWGRVINVAFEILLVVKDVDDGKAIVEFELDELGAKSGPHLSAQKVHEQEQVSSTVPRWVTSPTIES